MATMIPSDISEFKTEGEGKFYRFLENAAVHNSEYIAWYTPDINGREPDFLIYAKDVGIVIFEVKDWALEQIVKADTRTFTLKSGSRTEDKKNPYHQAREYYEQTIDKIKKDTHLVSKNPVHHGNPRIPIHYGVVLANINRYEYTQKGLDRVIGTDKIFFWDDLHPESDICTDSTGTTFRKILKDKFPPQFPFSLTAQELSRLRQLIFPSVTIELPERKKDGGYIDHKRQIQMLDHHQEAIARKHDSGHRLLVGPSGSGKTIVLVHKAGFMKQYNPAIKNILFVCYNITLVNYIKRLLSGKKIPLGENGVEVMHFFELCSRIIKEAVHYENEDSDYYKTVIEMALEKVSEFPMRYDAVLVDEGQDFSDEMYKVLVSLLNKKTDSFTIALDDNQNIYRSRQSWKELGIKAQGRIHRMHHVYRNTRQIQKFAQSFMGQQQSETKEHEGLFPDFFDFRGPPPVFKKCESMGKVISFIGSTIESLAENEYALSEIAVIYTVKSRKDTDDFHLPRELEKELQSKGIISTWVSEDYRSKRSYDVTTNSVTISTIHSVKGFDYACVFLIGLDMLEPGEIWSEEQLVNLTYVAITRARYRLYIPYTAENLLVKRLLVAAGNSVTL